MNTTDIEALIAEGRYRKLASDERINPLAGKLADALERQQAELDELKRLVELAGGVARKALAALNAPPEGDGT